MSESRQPWQLDWKALAAKKGTFFPWLDVKRAWDEMDPNIMTVSITFAQEELGPAMSPCPQCGVAAEDLGWISIGSTESAWNAGDERVGWLTICCDCAIQVRFVMDEELLELRRDGNW